MISKLACSLTSIVYKKSEKRELDCPTNGSVQNLSISNFFLKFKPSLARALLSYTLLELAFNANFL